MLIIMIRRDFLLFYKIFFSVNVKITTFQFSPNTLTPIAIVFW